MAVRNGRLDAARLRTRPERCTAPIGQPRCIATLEEGVMNLLGETENTLPFDCKACGNSWDEPFPLPMEISLMGKRVMRVRCPKCDANSKKLNINFGRSAP